MPVSEQIPQEGVILDTEKPVQDGRKTAVIEENLDLKEKTIAEKPKDKKIETEKKEKAVELEKEHYEILLSILRKTISTFKERDKNRFNALIRPEDMKPAEEASINIEKLLSSKNIDLDALNTEIAKITVFVANIGKVRRQGAVREDTDNLRDIIICMNGLESSSENIIKQNTKKDSDPAIIKSISMPLHELTIAAQGSKRYIVGLYKALEGYHR